MVMKEAVCKPSRLKETMPILHPQETHYSMYNFVLHECLLKKALPENKLVHAHMI